MESTDDNLSIASDGDVKLAAITSDVEDNLILEKEDEILDNILDDDTGDKTEETETKDDEPESKADDSKEDMDVEESDVKKEPARTNWVDVIEKENNAKLLSELNKIGKLVSIDDKRSEINDMVRKHKIVTYPLSPEDLSDAFIVDLMKKCPNSHVQFRSVVDEEGTAKVIGMLELTFGKLSDVQPQIEQLSQFRENIHVSHSADNSDYRKFMQDWRAAAKLPENPRNNRLSLFAPSLPESVTEEEMWELFPKAHEIWLVPGTPRQHAYISFCSEELMSEMMEELRNRGPPRSDFNFCRLIRFSKIMEIVREERAKKRSGGRGGRGPGVDSPGRRRPGRRMPRRRLTSNRDDKTDADKDKNDDEDTKENGTASSRANGSGNNGPDKAKRDWYSRTRASHLDRLRTQRRNEARNRIRNPRRPRDSPRRPRDMSPRPRADRSSNQGLQMLDNLLSALGQASGTGRVMNQNQPRRDVPPGRRSASPRGRRPNAPGQRNRRPRRRDGRNNARGNQNRRNDGPGFGASPGKRTHSTEDLFRPRDGKRPRQDSLRDRNMRDEDYRQSSIQDLRGEYRTPPSRNAGGPYRPDGRDYGRLDHDERRYERSKPVENLNMLSALTSLARRVRQNPGHQDAGYSGQMMGSGASWSQSRRDNYY